MDTTFFFSLFHHYASALHGVFKMSDKVQKRIAFIKQIYYDTLAEGWSVGVARGRAGIRDKLHKEFADTDEHYCEVTKSHYKKKGISVRKK